MTDISSCTVILLAAQRAGAVNPLAGRAGVSHKCLAPICGKPLIVHVMDAVTQVPAVNRIRVSVEPEVHGELEALLAPYAAEGRTFDFVPSSSSIVESVLAAAQDLDGPFVITTADNVLLTPETFEAVLEALRDGDVVMNLATKTSVRAVHPEAQRGFYEFRDEGYANCNLYGIGGRHAFAALEIFREGGQFMNNPKRLVTAFGLFNILLFRFRMLTLEGAAKRLSRQFGMKFCALVPADGSQAVDVDNERTYGVAEIVLEKRQAGG